MYNAYAERSRGFTLVELLITIVVIAILAVISVVSYRGITGRANDTAVQADIRNFSNKVSIHSMDSGGEYPQGPNASGGSNQGAPIGMEEGFRLSHGSYDETVRNFYYCVGNVSGEQVFAVGAKSKSGNIFYYNSQQGRITEYTGTWGASAQNCPGMLPGVASGWTFSYGRSTSGSWYAWVR